MLLAIVEESAKFLANSNNNTIRQRQILSPLSFESWCVTTNGNYGPFVVAPPVAHVQDMLQTLTGCWLILRIWKSGDDPYIIS